MVLEVVGALALTGLVLWLVFAPASRNPDLDLAEPDPPEETRRGIALLALKEIEFDRETGKLSDADYQMLRTRYAAEAVAALDAEGLEEPGIAGSDDPENLISARVQLLRSARFSGSPLPASCPRCGPRPEAEACFCSECGISLRDSWFCSGCGASLAPDSRFCANCGVPVAA